MDLGLRCRKSFRLFLGSGIVLSIAALLLLGKTEGSLFGYVPSTALENFVHYWQELKPNRTCYCLLSHQTWRRCRSSCGANRAAGETLLQELRTEWTREAAADRMTQWGGKEHESTPAC